MIGWIKGRPLKVGPDFVIVAVGGLGYQVHVTGPTLAQMAQAGEVELWTHAHYREEAQLLYGFSSWEELTFFKMIIAVDGIGPKAALAIMGSGSIDSLKQAVLREDKAFIARAQGVGPKTAARLILEIRAKLGEDLDLSSLAGAATPAADRAVAALGALGFTDREAKAALAQANWEPDWEVAEVVRVALKELGSH